MQHCRMIVSERAIAVRNELEDVLRVFLVVVLNVLKETAEYVDLVAGTDRKRSTSDPNRVVDGNRCVLAHVDVDERRPSWLDLDIGQALLAHKHNIVRKSNGQDRLEIRGGRPVKILDLEAGSDVSKAGPGGRKCITRDSLEAMCQLQPG